MHRSLWAPTQANDLNPPNSGALGRIEGWPDERPLSTPIRINDHSVLCYLTLKRMESWDTVRSQIVR